MNFKFQYILLVIIALCMGACATQHGGGAGSRYDGLTASSSPDARFIIVNESVPPLKTFMSGRSALDDLVKLGSQVEDSPSRVRLPNLAFVIEKAIYERLIADGFNEKKFYIKAGRNAAPADIVKRAGGVTSGHILDTKIVEWDAVEHPDSRERMNVYVTVQTRIYDIAAQKVVMDYECHKDTGFEDVKEAPGRTALLKNNMDLLKRHMRDLTSACAAETINEFFGSKGA